MWRKETVMIASWPHAPGRMGRLLLGGLLAIGLCAVGCGPRGSMPKTYKVTGSVIVKGGKPLSSGAIQFSPVADTSYSVTGDISNDGTFTLRTVKGNDRANGAPEGEYRVTILLPIPEDQRAPPPIVLPKTCKVEPKDNHFSFEIDPPRKR
jgi:hypothetical protein